MPASILMKVVLPVPFSPSITRISLSVKEPSSTSSLKEPCNTQRGQFKLTPQQLLLDHSRHVESCLVSTFQGWVIQNQSRVAMCTSAGNFSSASGAKMKCAEVPRA